VLSIKLTYIKHIIILFLSKSSTIFYYDIWSCDSMIVCNSDMWHHTNPTLMKRKKIQNERENKIKQSPLFIILTVNSDTKFFSWLHSISLKL